MLRQETAMNIRKNFGEILDYVEYRHDSVLITRGGKPSAAIVDINLFNKVRKLSKKFESLSTQLKDSFNDYLEEKINGIVEEAVTSVRRKN